MSRSTPASERLSARPGRRTARPAAAVRPLDDAATEQVTLIEFVWRAGSRVQPVLWLDRELLH